MNLHSIVPHAITVIDGNRIDRVAHMLLEHAFEATRGSRETRVTADPAAARSRPIVPQRSVGTHFNAFRETGEVNRNGEEEGKLEEEGWCQEEGWRQEEEVIHRTWHVLGGLVGSESSANPRLLPSRTIVQG